MNMMKSLIARSAAVGLVLFAACVGARADVIDNYAFSNATYSSNDATADLSGTFSWDATTNSIVASDINLSGTIGAGAVDCSNCSTGIYGGENFAINLGSQALYLTFANPLSLGENDPLSLSANGGNNQPEFQGNSPFSSVTGSADIATPEPPSFTFLATGLLALGFFFVWRRRTCA